MSTAEETAAETAAAVIAVVVVNVAHEQTVYIVSNSITYVASTLASSSPSSSSSSSFVDIIFIFTIVNVLSRKFRLLPTPHTLLVSSFEII